MTGAEKAKLIPKVFKDEKFEKKEYMRTQKGKTLLFSDTICLTKHIPLLRYSAGYETLMNTFVEEIVIADVSGIQIDMDDEGEACTTRFDDVIIAYVTTPAGEHFLLEPEIRDWLLTEKKDFAVTSQGVIIGFSKNVLHTTLDGMYWQDFTLETENIENVEEILAIDYDEENDIEIITAKHEDGKIRKFGLIFEFNFNEECQYNVVIGTKE